MDLDSEIVSLMKQNAVRVPPYPAAAFKLQSLLARPEHDLDQVVEAVKSDPTLAAAVLRVANSVYFRRGQPATTLKAAVQRVGETELQRLALAAGLAHAALEAGPLADLRHAVWHDAMTSAVVCEVLARVTGGDQEGAFVLGLLHDVGRLVALGTIEQILQRFPDERARSAADWSVVVERYHVELGLVLAARWGLPDIVSDAISQHHAAGVPLGSYSAQVQQVMAGDQVVQLLEAHVAISEQTLSAVPWLTSAAQRAAVAAALADIGEVVASFEPDAPPTTRRSMVRSEPAPDVERHDGGFSVRLVARDLACQGLRLAPSNVHFASATALTPNFLSELELQVGDDTVRFWAKVVRCEVHGDVHHVEATPFALCGEALECWRRATRTLACPARRPVRVASAAGR